jgi:hypothetical protein
MKLFNKRFLIGSLIFFPCFFGFGLLMNHFGGYDLDKSLADVFTRSRIVFSIVFYVFLNLYQGSKVNKKENEKI